MPVIFICPAAQKQNDLSFRGDFQSQGPFVNSHRETGRIPIEKREKGVRKVALYHGVVALIKRVRFSVENVWEVLFVLSIARQRPPPRGNGTSPYIARF